MMLSFQTLKVPPPLAIFLVTFSVLILPRLMMPPKALSAPEAYNKDFAQMVRMIKLYTVQDGKPVNRILDPSDLLNEEPIEVKGYVTGILILANAEMSVQVDGQTMSKIRKNSDGTYSIKYFGKVGSSEIELTPSNTYYEKGRSEENGGANIEGYSLFPKIVGDAVSPLYRFQIDVEIGGTSCALPVQQNGYHTFHTANLDLSESKKPIEFQYLGERLDKHMERPNSQERLRAITEGIKSVEKTFGANLVDRVKIVDYEKIHNAVTCEEKRDIWFYVNTFLGEPLDELRTIAEHEALHILVDQQKLAKDLGIRELFSDLRGYDTFSRERFAVITRGASSNYASGDDIPYRDFFAFIDEKNFLEGMKGGHSSQNVDEFCTSFLHSLMFLDRLESNLKRSIKIGEGEQDRFLNAKKRHSILKNYIRTIETLLSAQQSGVPDSSGIISLLRRSLNHAERIPM